MKHDEDIASSPTAVAPDPEPSSTDSAALGATASASAPRDLAPGDKAGDYTVVRRLGGGAMGDVYEGVHPDIAKRVAIKVVKHVLADSDDAAERFRREARAVNTVGHPNVLDVFAFGRLADGRLYLAMDLLEGQSLGARIRSAGALDLDAFERVLTAVCGALSAAHAGGIIHRDLKPDNVFLARSPTRPNVEDDEQVFVLDFGIAKIVSDASQNIGGATLTGEGVWIGTPAYMAPEQWASDGATARSDIYALGVMMYEMLTGKVPYQAESVPAIMEKHFHAEVPSLATGEGVLPLPDDLDAVVRRAMAKKPEERFATADELLAAALRAMSGASRRGPVAAGASPTVSERGIPRPRRTGTAVLAAAVLATAGAALWWVSQRAGDSEVTETGADDETASPAPAPGRAISLYSHPAGAQVRVDGSECGKTPTRWDPSERKDPAASSIVVEMTKPGYFTSTRELALADAGERVDLTLTPVRRFEGRWRLTTGELRYFEREGEQVAGYRLHSEQGGDREALGLFEFAPADDGWVVFGRSAEAIDERNPSDSSCRRWLRAEYRYHPESDRLVLRRERVSFRFENGRCTAQDHGWTDLEPATRIAHSDAAPVVEVVSTAGAGPVWPNDGTANDLDLDLGNAEPPQLDKGAIPKRAPEQKKAPRSKTNAANAKRRKSKGPPIPDTVSGGNPTAASNAVGGPLGGEEPPAQQQKQAAPRPVQQQAVRELPGAKGKTSRSAPKQKRNRRSNF